MTNTTLVNGLTLSAGRSQNPTKTSFQANTTGYSVSITITMSNWPQGALEPLQLYVASSSVSVTAAVAADQLRRSAAILSVNPPRTSSTITQNFPLLARLGDYLYCWIEVPNFPVACVATVILWENA